MAISALGMALHTIREFGLPGLVSPDTGMIPVVAVQLALLSVLPLPFLPFEPGQTAGHYLSHVILGIAQLPLVVAALATRRGGRP